MTDNNLAAMIDEFGALKAAKAELEKREKAFKENFAELEAGSYEGDLFRLNVLEFPVTSIGWEAIAMKLKPSKQLITAHTSQRDQRTLRVGARTGKEKRAA